MENLKNSSLSLTNPREECIIKGKGFGWVSKKEPYDSIVRTPARPGAMML